MEKGNDNLTFVNLHNHSNYSLLDGLSSVKDLAKKAKEYGQPAVALTDHGNIFGSVHFYKACEKEGVKAILGVEAYFVHNIEQTRENKDRTSYHIVLLAMNNNGWANIVKLVSASNTPEQFYYKPLIDWRLLEKYSDDIIILTACMGGLIAKPILEDRMDEAIDNARRLYSVFGDRLYFEIQNNGLQEQFKLNLTIYEIAANLKRPTVATVDSHYLNRADSAAHIELKVMDYKDRKAVMDSGFGLSSEFYFKKENEVVLPKEDRDVTIEIAERCNVTMDLKRRRYPSYKPTWDEKEWIKEQGIKDNVSEELLRYKLREGWVKRLTPEQRKDEKYMKRAKKELDDIMEAGFVDYFLITADFVNWAKEQNIWIGPSRGSAAGSLLVYLLNITDVDPIKYDLIFERFYNKGRAQSAPDIDVDIELRYRKNVLEYIRGRFGKERVVQLATFNTLGARAVLKDLMNVNGIDFATANEITACIPLKGDDHGAISLENALKKSEKLKAYSEDDNFKQCFKFAEKIEGTPKSVGTHAAAVIIAERDLSNGDVPLVRSPDGKDLVCGWDMKAIDMMNILKCDLLGLATLEVLHRCCDMINARYGEKWTADKLNAINMKDEDVFDLLCLGYSDGVFQLESHLGKKWLRSLLPRSINDMADLSSLLRPGPLDSGMSLEYKKVKFGESEPTYIHESLKPILEGTHTALIFQEQVIEICNKIAKMSLEESDKLRKIIGKKQPDEMKKWKDKFISAVVKNSNINKENAEAIWGWIEAFAGYGFNRSHSISYSILAYRTSYFKTYYPLEFLCSCLICARYSQKPIEEIKRFVNDAKLFDIVILPPDIRLGNVDFDIDSDGRIRFGLGYIKDIGIKSIDDVNDSFSVSNNNFYDFMFRGNLNRKIVVALIYSGALDCFFVQRQKMLDEYELFKGLTVKQQENVVNIYYEKIYYELDMKKFSVLGAIAQLADEDRIEYWKNRNIRPPNIKARIKLRGQVEQCRGKEFMSNDLILAREKEYIGISVTSKTKMSDARYTCLEVKKDVPPCTQNVDVIGRINNIKMFKTKKSNEDMAFIEVEDASYSLDGIIIFPRVYERTSPFLSIGRVINIKGYLTEDKSFICNELTPV